MAPKDSGNSRSASRKRGRASDQEKKKGLEAVNGLDTSYDAHSEAPNPARELAFSAPYLRRLADVALFFKKSFLNDLDAVERDYGSEIIRNTEIESLNQAIVKMTHAKSEEMDNLKAENAALKAREDACCREREECRKLQADMEAQKAIADAERKQEYQRKMEEDKVKAQKRMDTKKAEMETEFNKRVRELETRGKDLATENQRLKGNITELQEHAEKKKIKHKREMQGLDSELERTASELKQIKSDFPHEGQPFQYYLQKFLDISTAVKKVSFKHFQELSEYAAGNPEALHEDLCKQNPVFELISPLPTDISRYVRAQIARSIICNCLCNCIWQPFLTEGSCADYQVLNNYLEGLSKTLLDFGGRGESAWRILTLRGIDSLPRTLVNSQQTKSILDKILGTLKPLIVSRDSTELENDLRIIINESISTWHAARMDENKFIVDIHPTAHDKEKWGAEDIQVPQEASSRSERPEATILRPLCLFPNIVQINPGGETVVVCKGSALFPDSFAWNQAIMEKNEHARDLETAVLEARSRVNARRLSFPNGPNTNVAGKGSGFANLQSFQFK